jgi:hypothetical protein
VFRIIFAVSAVSYVEIENRMLNKIIANTRNLSLVELRELAVRLGDEIRQREKALAANSEMVEEKSIDSICYQLVKTRCGKKECSCARGELHGPYWYACFREGGKNRRKYMGKTLPDSGALLQFSLRLREKAEAIRLKSDRKGKEGRCSLLKACKALMG